VERFKMLFDAIGRQALKNAMARVQRPSLDQAAHDPPIEFHPVFGPSRLPIGPIAMPLSWQEKNNRSRREFLASPRSGLQPSPALGDKKDLEGLERAAIFKIKMVV